MKKNFAPEPWSLGKIDYSADVIYIYGPRNSRDELPVVASVRASDLAVNDALITSHQMIATARLIAAAPDLLQELLNIANAKLSNFENDTEYREWAQSRARHAIAKAADEI